MAREAVEIRARRAYERARLGLGVRAAIPALFLGLGGLVLHQGALWCALICASLCLAVIAFVWRGGAWARPVGPAIALGLIPLAAPLCTLALAPVCVGGACISSCVLACCAAGLAAGVIFAARFTPASREGWIAGAVLLGLTGSIGCACAGAPGLIGMLIGGLAGAMPVGYWARAQASE